MNLSWNNTTVCAIRPRPPCCISNLRKKRISFMALLVCSESYPKRASTALKAAISFLSTSLPCARQGARGRLMTFAAKHKAHDTDTIATGYPSFGEIHILANKSLEIATQTLWMGKMLTATDGAPNLLQFCAAKQTAAYCTAYVHWYLQ